ncbi:MAG: hypothetical protein RLZZ333_2109 [Bacteroidota bacterium]
MSAEKVMHAAQKPFTAIIGGAKVSDKILIIENKRAAAKPRPLFCLTNQLILNYE